MTKALLVSRKTKEKLYSKKIRSPTFTNERTFRDYNKIYTSLCKHARVLYFHNKFTEAGANMKNTWDTVREALETPNKASSLPGFFYKDGVKIRGDKEIAMGNCSDDDGGNKSEKDTAWCDLCDLGFITIDDLREHLYDRHRYPWTISNRDRILNNCNHFN